MSENLPMDCFINGQRYKCRTCFYPGSFVTPLIDECSDTKTWHDLLKEVAQLQTTEDDFLPKTICSKCMNELAKSYDFILQVKNVNNKYMELLGMTKDHPAEQTVNNIESNEQILSESDNTMSMEEFISEVKTEAEELTPYDIVLSKNFEDDYETCEENVEKTSMHLHDQNSYSSSHENGMWSLYRKIRKINKNFVCPKCRKKFKSSTACRQHLDIAHSLESSEQTSNSSSEEESDNLPEENNPTDDTFDSDKIQKIDNYYVCPICKGKFKSITSCRFHISSLHLKPQKFTCSFCYKTFKCRNYFGRHLKRKHPRESIISNTKQLQFLFGDRLYSKPSSWLKVECNLCLITFSTTKELRKHLEIHSDAKTLEHLKLSDGIVKQFFSNINNLEIVKKTIVEDILENNLFKYYSVVNEYNYEMSISDTEVEDLAEETQHAGNYTCELCLEEFSFKYQVFCHLKEKHLKEEIPLKCVLCKLEFVSVDMHKKHLKTHCRNEDKNLCCEICPARFVNSENLKKHDCYTNTLKNLVKANKKKNKKLKLKTVNVTSNRIQETIIRCALCDSTFQKLHQLHQHMPLHADGKNGIDFKNSIYVKVFKHDKLYDYPLWQKEIKEDYSKAHISLFYLAVDKYGNELDISDSDSTDDTCDIIKQYTCDICKIIYFKRKLLLNHQRERHNDITLPFNCKSCNQQFVNIDLLQQHLKKFCWNKHRINGKQCEHCNNRFIWPENLVKHIEMQHTSRNLRNVATTSVDVLQQHKLLYYCLMCPKTFFTIKNLEKHLVSHCLTPKDINKIESIVHSTLWPNDEKKIICKYCDETFNTLADLKKHFSPTNPKNFCADSHSLANYSITNQNGFELHLELDSETEIEDTEETVFPYICYICSKSFKRKYLVAQHQRSMHNYKSIELKCERCIFRSVSTKMLDYHKATQCFNEEKEYECHKCTFKFMWEENLKNHELTFHADNDETNAVYTIINDNNSSNCKQTSAPVNDKPLCTICGVNFSSFYNLQVHLMRHKGEKLDNCVDSEKLPYPCTICPKSFTKLEILKLHLLQHKGEKPYECNVCNKKFACEKYLRIHRNGIGHKESDVAEPKTNTSRPYECNICKKKLKSRRTLVNHQSTHNAERTYKCSLCEKSYVTKNLLIIHSRIHSGERPYKCKFCEKSFIDSANLKLHIRLHTGEKPYKCEVCDKAFLNARYLKRHCIIMDHYIEK